jgi:hypothetical protein
MFRTFKSIFSVLEGAMTAIVAHSAAWMLRIPIEKLYHKILYLFGHVAVTLAVMRLFENR